MSDMTRDEILIALDAAGLGHYRAEAEALLQPAISLQTVPMPESELTVGASKMGGTPDLPLSVPWPHWKGLYRDYDPPRPLHFLAQVNFADAHAVWPESPLPPSGLLSVFYDADVQPWGNEEYPEGIKLIYTPDVATLERCIIPEQLRALAGSDVLPSLFDSCALNVTKTLPLAPLLRLPHTDDEHERLYAALPFRQNMSGFHQMLGKGDYVHDPIEYDLANAALGITDHEAFAAPEGSPLKTKLDDELRSWHLLLQIDSDRNPGWMWGDAGLLYFHIHARDLAACDFGSVHMELQCS